MINKNGEGKTNINASQLHYWFDGPWDDTGDKGWHEQGSIGFNSFALELRGTRDAVVLP